MSSSTNDVSIAVSKDGPYIVSGNVTLTEQVIGANTKGESVQWQPSEAYHVSAKFALCRCGNSNTPPFCDGTHAKVGFDGTEIAVLLRSEWQGMESSCPHRRSAGPINVSPPSTQLPSRAANCIR